MSGSEEPLPQDSTFAMLNREAARLSGVAQEPRKSGRARFATAVCVVLVLAIAILGFLVSVPTTSAVVVPYLSTSTGEVAVTTASLQPHLVTVPTAEESTATNASVIAYVHYVSTTAQVLTVSRTTLYCNESVYSRTYLPSGAEVQVTWNATGKVDAYVFDSAQFEWYLRTEQITSSTVNETGKASGSMRFRTQLSDSYFFLLLNPPSGPTCLGAGTIWVSSPGGPAAYSYPVTSYTTELASYTTTILLNSTETRTTTVALTSTSTKEVLYTLTSTSTAQCAVNLWAWLLGTRACQ